MDFMPLVSFVKIYPKNLPNLYKIILNPYDQFI